MGPNVILLVEPSIERLLSLFDTVKPFGVEDLMTKDAIKAFVLAVFLRAALKDLDRRYISLCTPVLRLLSNSEEDSAVFLVPGTSSINR